jgi:hypothetical protein
MLRMHMRMCLPVREHRRLNTSQSGLCAQVVGGPIKRFRKVLVVVKQTPYEQYLQVRSFVGPPTQL